MKEPFYTVIENRILLNNAFSPVVQHYIGDETSTDPETGVTRVLTAEDRATSRFHAICSAAAVSVIPYHSVHLLANNGAIVDMRVWDRRTNTPGQPAGGAAEGEA